MSSYKKLTSTKHSNYGTNEMETSGGDEFSTKQKSTNFPKASLFILATEFCERYSHYGLRAILTLYLRNVLLFTEDTSTIIYHGFIMLAYVTPLFGAIIADSLLNKYRTIFYLSLVYACGNLVLSAAATPPLSLPPIPFSMVGLVLIAVGTGGIKPCVGAFGGDQFQIPGQESQLQTFFSVFYFAINSGSLLSTIVTPIFRQDVSCFGDSTCYSLAFGVPSLLLCIALIIFLLGKSLYRIREPEGNLLVKVVNCMGHAISNRRQWKYHAHWLDCAEEEYGAEFVDDIKTLLRISVLYIPLPFFWALLEQQGSRWTLQSTRTDGRVGIGWTVKPDQMQVVNAILVLLLIPLFDKCIYPMFAWCNILKKPLQRITVGGILVAVAFVIAGVVELQIEPTYPIVPEISQTSFNFVNTLPCSVNISLSAPSSSSNHIYGPNTILPNENVLYNAIQMNNYTVEVSSAYIFDDRCFLNGEEMEFAKIDIAAQSSTAYSVLLSIDTMIDGEGKEKAILQLKYSEASDELAKSLEGYAKLRIITDVELPENSTFLLESLNNIFETTVEINDVATTTSEFPPDKYVEYPFVVFACKEHSLPIGFDVVAYLTAWKYNVRLVWSAEDVGINLENIRSGMAKLGAIFLEPGGSYLLSISPNYTFVTEPLNYTVDWDDTANLKDYLMINLYTLTKPNSVNMMWQLPQYLLLTTGEILFSITGYCFSYTQAPKSMKSVIQSLWLLTNGFGNLIVIIVTEINVFERQASEFFFYSGMMFAASLVFIFLAKNFKSKDAESDLLLE